jgi:aryl-alcohol dehydrogenase-like predicted oxidoreductase
MMQFACMSLTTEHAPFLAGRAVNRLGYGAAFRVAGRIDHPDLLDSQERICAVLRRAVSLGVDFIDTADSYGGGGSERLIARTLYPYPAELRIATKSGVAVDAERNRRLNGRPQALKAACEASLRRLRVETIDLYQLHWPDPAWPLEDQVGALEELRAAGKVRQIGLCNVTVAQAEAACAVAPIAAVQNRFGVADQGQWPMIEWCAARGILFIAYSPLAVLRDPGGGGGRVAALAASGRVTVAQLALHWLRRCAPAVLAIPGTISIAHVEENMASAACEIPLQELTSLVSWPDP